MTCCCVCYATGYWLYGCIVAADRKLVANKQIGSFFIGYAAHDYHMLIFAAMYAGQYAVARDTALAMVAAHASPALLPTLPAAVVNGQEGFVGVLLHVYLRFGKWSEIAEYPMPTDTELYSATTATLHYARAIMHGKILFRVMHCPCTPHHSTV